MRASQAGQFPLSDATTAHTLGVVSSVVPGIKRGIRYRVVSTQDCWLSYNQAAVVAQGLYLPAKMPDYFAFGMSDSEGTDLELNVIAAFAGTIYFTPIKVVPTE